MTIKITSTAFEALARTPEVPEPIPLQQVSGNYINPMLFPVDWSIQIDLETSWQTDVTQSLDMHEDRWSLNNRPGRILRARIVGATKQECDAMLQSCFAASSQFGFPVPIYPDAAAIDSVDGTAILGSFGHRRFFRGGRVAIMSHMVDPDQSEESVSFASVVEVTPSRMVLNYDQGTSRLATTQDVVIPCMDVEMVAESSGVALTDGVLALELEWAEIDGSSSLPASWPFTSPSDASILEPLCTVINGRGLFPFNPDWQSGVDISTRRLIDSDRAGRTSVQDPSGEPFLDFNLQIMGYDRPSCWRVARFFDAHRGRAASFWFEHPMRPFLLTASDVDFARIRKSGNVEHVKQTTKFLLLTDINGDQHIREVLDVVDTGTHYQFDFDTIPEGQLTDAQPVFVCRFDQDSLVESWNTDEVQPSMQLRIIQEPKLAGPVPAASFGLGVSTPLTAFTSLGECTLLLRPGAQCFDLSGRPALPYPSSVRNCRVWRDSSTPYDVDGAQARARPYLTSASTICTVALPSAQNLNNGQPFIFNPFMTANWMLDASVPIEDRQLWGAGNSGWTIVVVITPYVKAEVTGSRYLFDIVTTGQFVASIAFDQSTLITPYTSVLALGPWNSIVYQEITVDRSGADTPTIFCLHHEGGISVGGTNKVRVWVNGQQAAAPFNINLVDVTSFTTANFFGGFPTWNQGINSIRSNWAAGNPAVNFLASYKEGLALGPLRELHERLSDLFQINIQVPTLY